MPSPFIIYLFIDFGTTKANINAFHELCTAYPTILNFSVHFIYFNLVYLILDHFFIGFLITMCAPLPFFNGKIFYSTKRQTSWKPAKTTGSEKKE